MLTVGTKIKLIAFALIAVAILAFTAVRYANLGRLFGLSGYYTVKMELPNAGGLFPNADVTYRGVSVGRVGTMGLTSTGIVVDLQHQQLGAEDPVVRPAGHGRGPVRGRRGVRQPAAADRPGTLPGRQIGDPGAGHPGSAAGHQRAHQHQYPGHVGTQQSLRTLVAELGNAFQGQGRTCRCCWTTAARSLTPRPRTSRRPASSSGTGRPCWPPRPPTRRRFSRSAAMPQLLASQLASSDADLRRLIINTPQAALQVTGLLRDNNVSLSAVIANLLTTSNVTLTRQPALEEMLSALPAAVAAGSTVINSHGANFGVALTFFNPLPCTAGYGGTVYRNGLNLSPSPPLNTSARCTLPASSGVDVRGSAHAPSGGAVPPATRPGRAPHRAERSSHSHHRATV